jgi:hypothetical protein
MSPKDAKNSLAGVSAAETPIEVRVERISQLFNSLDPYPFQQRDLDKEAEEYIVGWARELRADRPITIIVHLPAEESRSEVAQNLAPAFAAYFNYRADLVSRDLSELLRLGRWSLLIGLAVLTTCLFSAHILADRFGHGQVASTAQESLLIVGWVANWRPIEVFLYDWWPVQRRRNLYRRLAHAQVIVQAR